MDFYVSRDKRHQSFRERRFVETVSALSYLRDLTMEKRCKMKRLHLFMFHENCLLPDKIGKFVKISIYFYTYLI